MNEHNNNIHKINNKIGCLYIVIAACFWGMIGIFVREINQYGITSIQIVALRALGATIVLLLYLGIFKREKLRIKLADIWVFLGTGIGSMVFFNFCYFGAIARTSLAVAAALLYTAPAFVAVFARIFIKEPISKKRWITIVCVIIGCALTSGIFTGGLVVDLAGLMLGLGSGLGYALYSILGKIAIKKGYTNETITFYTFLFTMLSTVWIFAGKDFRQVDFAPSLIGALAGLILISTVFAYLLYTKGLSVVNAGQAAVLASIEPLVATVIGILIYKEILHWDVGIGILMILLSTIV